MSSPAIYEQFISKNLPDITFALQEKGLDVTVATAIYAIYTIIPDNHTVRIWAFLEGESNMERERLRFHIVEILRDKLPDLPDEIIHFEFHVIPDTSPPFDVESGGHWNYMQPMRSFQGVPSLIPAVDHFINSWKQRTGQDSD